YGRKASCCALLKRCTSSTKRMVLRPCSASERSAATTASRMSFTPERTAESAMNSASKASAMRRASVVLPDPGGPHRIIECGLPDSKATRSGLPGPSRCFWPTTSSSVRGRRRSASGAAGWTEPNKSFPKHVHSLWRREAECACIELRIALHVGEAQHRGLAEVVQQFHRVDARRGQAQADAVESGFLFAWLGLQPFQAVFRARFRKFERLIDVGSARKQRRRRCA